MHNLTHELISGGTFANIILLQTKGKYPLEVNDNKHSAVIILKLL